MRANWNPHSAMLEAAVLRPDEACVDNRALTRAALIAAERAGAKIFPRQRLSEPSPQQNSLRWLVRRRRTNRSALDGHRRRLLLRTNNGSRGYAPVRPAKGQMLALRAKDVKIDRVLWSEQVYLVPRDDGRIVAGATVEYVGFEKGVSAGAIRKHFGGHAGACSCAGRRENRRHLGGVAAGFCRSPADHRSYRTWKDC